MRVGFAWVPTKEESKLIRRLFAGLNMAVPKSKGEIERIVLDSDLVLCWRSPKREVIEKTKARFVQSLSVGVDTFDLGLLEKRDILLANCPGSNSAAVAEWAFFLMLACPSGSVEMVDVVRKGGWLPYSYESTHPEIFGKTLGIVGFGGIGKELAKRGKAFGMKVGVYSRSRRKLRDVVFVKNLKDLMKSSDFVVLCCPLTKKTWGMVGKRELGWMKRTAFLINVGRAQVVEETALYRALKNQWIAGAGIDSWYSYHRGYHRGAKPSSLGIEKLPNVVPTPHRAGWTREAYERSLRMAAENVKRFVTGLKPKNLIDYGKGY